MRFLTVVYTAVTLLHRLDETFGFRCVILRGFEPGRAFEPGAGAGDALPPALSPALHGRRCPLDPARSQGGGGGVLEQEKKMAAHQARLTSSPRPFPCPPWQAVSPGPGEKAGRGRWGWRGHLMQPYVVKSWGVSF